MQTDGREIDGETAAQLNSPLDSVDELGNVGMTWVEARVGVDDANDWTKEGIFTVAHGLDEELSHEEREMGVPV